MARSKASEPRYLRETPHVEAPRRPETLGAYPQVRMRRNRGDAWSRQLVAECRLSAADFIWPLFIKEGQGSTDVESMPGVARHGLDKLVDVCGEAVELGVPVVALFPYLESALKTPDCAEAANPENLVCRAIRLIKEHYPDLGVFCDVALDPYNSLGHDGFVVDGKIVNDETIEMLIKQSLVQVEAGCDVIGPSDMMDGPGSAQSAPRSTRPDTRTCGFAPTRRNMPRPSMIPSAMPWGRAVI